MPAELQTQAPSGSTYQPPKGFAPVTGDGNETRSGGAMGAFTWALVGLGLVYVYRGMKK